MANEKKRTNFAAIDLGATSGRVMLDTNNGKLEEIYRFPTPMLRTDEGIYWGFDELMDGIVTGLKKLADIADTIVSVSCDSWAQDFGMLDKDGKLIANPFSYRDSGSEIFTAARLEYIRSKFPERYEKAVQILHIADLVHYFLCGQARSNYTLAATGKIALDHKLLSPLADREIIGEINHPDLPEFAGIPVVSGAGHDTAAAYMGGNPQDGEVLISLGTWLMVAEPWEEGRDIPEKFASLPLPDKKLARTIGSMGMWPFQQCVKLWKEREVFPGYAVLDKAAEACTSVEGFIDPDTPSLFSPVNMEEAIFELYGRKLSPEEITALLLRGTAHRVALSVKAFGRDFSKAILVGGGAGCDYLRRMIAEKLDCPMEAGNTEASAAGNIAMQRSLF